MKAAVLCTLEFSLLPVAFDIFNTEVYVSPIPTPANTNGIFIVQPPQGQGGTPRTRQNSP